MKLKTHKSVSKRIQVSGSGKLLKRKNGKGHFNGRESGKVTRNKRRDLSVAAVYVNNVKSLIPNS
ncbi:50S ribosomal protein L35 [Patescibacteria group bacterium]|nr:50S ribosomal protein L35 [Patescibacteria group bacterium]